MSLDIASYIDHTILKPGTTKAEVEKICREALLYSFAAVCVPPCFVTIAADLLKGSRVAVATVIGFPLGYSTTAVKIAEIEQAIADGADELDMVQNLAILKSGDWKYLEDELESCLKVTNDAGKKLKLILETGELTDAELLTCCKRYSAFPVDFLKTSTGFSTTGASTSTVAIMRENLPERIAIKASGGIRNFAFAKELIDAGAGRIGCSASIQILEESKEL